jgi:hypothetical protein
MLVGLFTNVLNKTRGGQGEVGQSENGPGVAVLEPPAEASAPAPQAPSKPAATAPSTPATAGGDAKPDRKPCPQCGSTEPWGISSWCPNCFYHPRLGLPIAPVAPAGSGEEGTHHAARAESYAAVLKSVPLWTHVLWIGVVAVFVMSVYVSITLPKFGPSRAIWTLLQTLIGLAAAGTAHVLVFFNAIPNTDKYGPFDLFLKPLDFWSYAIRKMPAKAWRLWLFAWGLTASLAALVMIGGIRYSAMFETKSKKKSTWYQTSQYIPGERRSIWADNG